MANRIPRNFKRLYFTSLIDTNAGKAGEKFCFYPKDEVDGLYRCTNLRTGNVYVANLGIVRNELLTRIDEIVA